MALIGIRTRSGRFDFRQLPSPTVVFASLAVAAALGGLFLLVQTTITTTPLVGLHTEARGDTLSMWVRDVEMLDHSQAANASGDDDASGDQIDIPGFDMPASMMPGTPVEGFQRLQLELDFMNRRAGMASAAPVDFYLLSDEGEEWNSLLGGTFERTEIGPQQALNTIVAFDIPISVSSSEVQLVWTGDGEEIHFVLDAGEGQGHG